MVNEGGAQARAPWRQRLRPRSRPGAVLALVAISLVGLMAVTALAVDIGMLFSARAEAQRAADAAALAGASSFLDYDPIIQPVAARDTAYNRASNYAVRQTIMNDTVLLAEVTTEVKLDSQLVRVHVERTTVQLFFARIFGLQVGTVYAVAAAEAVNAGTSPCVKPFAIPDLWSPATPAEDIYTRAGHAPIWDFDAHLWPNSLPPGTCPTGTNGKPNCAPEVWNVPATYDRDITGYNSDARNDALDYQGKKYIQDKGRRIPLKMNSPHMTGPAGWFFPWRMPGSAGGSDYRDAIMGCVGDVSVGTNVPIETEPGNMIGPTDQGIRDLLNLDPGARWVESLDASGNTIGRIENSSFGPGGNGEGSPRVITIALINPTDVSNGMNTMRFVNFAQFFLEDPDQVYAGSEAKPNERPVTGRLIGYASGTQGPEEGTLIKRIRLIQ